MNYPKKTWTKPRSSLKNPTKSLKRSTSSRKTPATQSTRSKTILEIWLNLPPPNAMLSTTILMKLEKMLKKLFEPTLFNQLKHWRTLQHLRLRSLKPMQSYKLNRYSQAVTHPSTNMAQCCLTSVIRRELVFSTWYGRRQCMFLNFALLINYVTAARR